MAGLPVLVGSLTAMPRMFPLGCPGWRAGTEGSEAAGISVALCSPSVPDAGKAEMPLAQSASQLGCCGQHGRPMPQSVPAHCSAGLGEQ